MNFDAAVAQLVERLPLIRDIGVRVPVVPDQLETVPLPNAQK